MRREDPLRQQQLHALAVVPDRPLPVLCSLTPRDVLELVRGDPRVLLFAAVDKELSTQLLNRLMSFIYHLVSNEWKVL